MLSRLWSWWSGQSQSAPVDMNAICQINPNAKGIAVVIANRNTQGRTEKPLQGVIVDRDNMERALKILQFAVVTKTDIGRDEMLSLLTAVATYRNYPHTYQRMVMVFSGHGIKDALCTHDGSVTIDEIKDRFKPADCPKLFFIDACRGRFAMKKDGTTSPLIDYLMAFSTMPDHVSYEDSTYGGYWMSLLSRKLFEDKSIFDVLTIVNADLKKKYPKTQQPALDSALNVGVNLFQEAGCPQSPFLRDDERDSPSTPNGAQRDAHPPPPDAHNPTPDAHPPPHDVHPSPPDVHPPPPKHDVDNGTKQTGNAIREDDIVKIAGCLPEWQTVASKLGMGQLDIESIENNNRTPADQRKSFLRQWIWRDGGAATYEKLSEVLERLSQRGAAERIRGFAQRK
ncbi:hypothetical protein EMCRGX_G008824 [Ephydatia muelleri]